MKNRQIALAIGIAYVLGRRRKLTAALMLSTAAAAGRLGRSPVDLLRGGSGDSGGDDGRSGPIARLGEAGAAAARTAIGRPIESLSERLNERAESLRGEAAGGGGDRGSTEDARGDDR